MHAHAVSVTDILNVGVPRRNAAGGGGGGGKGGGGRSRCALAPAYALASKPQHVGIIHRHLQLMPMRLGTCGWILEECLPAAARQWRAAVPRPQRQPPHAAARARTDTYSHRVSPTRAVACESVPSPCHSSNLTTTSSSYAHRPHTLLQLRMQCLGHPRRRGNHCCSRVTLTPSLTIVSANRESFAGGCG